MNYYEEIKENLINNEVYKKIKDYSKNRSDLNSYYKVGKLLFEAGKHYGDDIIKEYSKKLTVDLNKSYTKSSLYNMINFYKFSLKFQTVSGKLSWSHYCEFLTLEDDNKILYYINISESQNLSIRQLRQKIRNKEYERLSLKTKNKLIFNDKLEVKDLVPNPILIKNKNNIEIVSEKILHQLVLEDIINFMKELGNGFSFIDSEYKIRVGDRYNYIDFLLYNIEFNCYVVVELKVTELKKEHIGQIQVYMNYIDTNLRKITQDKTIGIIICKKDNKFVMEYCSDDRIIAREYELI